MTTKDNELPYNTRNNIQVGKFQGFGIPAQSGKKYGGFTDNMNPKMRASKDKPPRKFN